MGAAQGLHVHVHVLCGYSTNALSVEPCTGMMFHFPAVEQSSSGLTADILSDYVVCQVES